MKIKLVTLVSLLAAVGLTLIFSNSALAQRSGAMEGSRPKEPTNTTTTTSASGAARTQQGATGSIVATPITPQDAAKKYPPPSSGKYPIAERDPHKASGVISSPYPPHQDYDCSQIAHGGLVLDTHVNKVFVRP
jgi:hypothetical protein